MEDSNTALPKKDRLELFFHRVREIEPAANHDEAMALLASTLNAIEDEFSGVPYNPDEPGTDGRMYAPKEIYRYPAWERSGIRCYRQVGHATFIADNGAIEIRPRKRGELADPSFEKAGKDGRKVSDP
jgi:hypothetical protein